MFLSFKTKKIHDLFIKIHIKLIWNRIKIIY
jgi:hypothetical protein